MTASITVAPSYVPCEQVEDFLGETDVAASSNGDVSVQWLYDRSKANVNVLITNSPEYQREKIASECWKQAILVTILTKTFAKIPQIHIRVQFKGLIDEIKEFDYEMMDGQQRVSAILDYLDGEFPLPDEISDSSGRVIPMKTEDGIDVAGLYAEELKSRHRDVYNRIMNYRITSVWYENLEDEQVSDLFVNILNNTNEMKPQEKRNAVRGNLSTYIRERSRVVEGKKYQPVHTLHPLFTRISVTKGDEKKEYLKYIPKLELRGRMEADEWLSQLLYMYDTGKFRKKNGKINKEIWITGVTHHKLTSWVKRLQAHDGDATSKPRWKKLQKRYDLLLDYALRVVESIDSDVRESMPPMAPLVLILYAKYIEEQIPNLKIEDMKQFTNNFFNVIDRWSDKKTKLYAPYNQLNGKQLQPLKDMFGGKNDNAIGTIFWILDMEREKDISKFGLIEVDPRETFSREDIVRKWKEQGKTCFYTNRPLKLEEAIGDHYKPRSWGIKKGGVTEYENLRVTSREINSKKGARSGEEFLKELHK